MDTASLLGDEASSLLDYTTTAFPKEWLTLPGPNFLDDVFAWSDRTPAVLRNLGTLYNHGRLGGTGYLSILPVDQGIEHSAAASFAPNPEYFDPENIVELAIEGGCNAVATTVGGLGIGLAPLRAPDTLHREAQPQRAADATRTPTTSRCSLRSSRHSTWAPWRRCDHLLRLRGVASTRSKRFARPSPRPTGSACSPSCGATCATTPSTAGGVDYQLSADLTGQGNHLGVTIEADIIKQKQAVNNGGYNAVKFGKTDPRSTPS